MVNRARVRPLNEARPGPGGGLLDEPGPAGPGQLGPALCPGTGPESGPAPGGGVLPGAGVSRATLRQYGFMLKGLEEAAGTWPI